MQFFNILLIDNSLRFTNSGFIKISAVLKQNNFIQISVLDTGSGIKTEDLNSLGSLNGNMHDIKRSTCGFGLFMSNLLCEIIEGESTGRKKGLTVYSKFGAGTCFNFYLNCDNISEKMVHMKEPPSEFNLNTIEQRRKLASLDNKFISVSSKEELPSKSLVIESESQRILKKNESLLEKIKERNGLQSSHSRTDCIASSRTILLMKKVVEEKSLSAKFFGQNTNNSISLNSSLIKQDIKMKCSCTKILIVDDVAFNLEVCLKLLKKLNFEADCAFNGLDAVEKIKSLLNPGLKNEPNMNMENENRDREPPKMMTSKFCEKCTFYKIILMDIDMPIKDGIEATQEILEILDKANIFVSIIGLSAFDQEQIKYKAISAGMKEYVTKPIHLRKMNEIIIKYM